MTEEPRAATDVDKAIAELHEFVRDYDVRSYFELMEALQEMRDGVGESPDHHKCHMCDDEYTIDCDSSCPHFMTKWNDWEIGIPGFADRAEKNIAVLIANREYFTSYLKNADAKAKRAERAEKAREKRWKKEQARKQEVAKEKEAVRDAKRERTAERVEAAGARALYDKGMTDEEIGHALGIGKLSVKEWRVWSNLPTIKVVKQQEEYKRQHEEFERSFDVNTVRRMYIEGEVNQEIAEAIGEDVKTVLKWKRINKLDRHTDKRAKAKEWGIDWPESR